MTFLVPFRKESLETRFLKLAAITENQRSKWSLSPLWLLTQSEDCKRHFSASSHMCRKLVFSSFQRAESEVQWSIQAHQKDDGVHVVRGHYKDQQTGKVAQAHRKASAIYTAQVQQGKANATAVCVGFHPSKATTTWLKRDFKDCKEILQWKDKSRQVGREKSKYRKKQLRRYRNNVILYTTFIKSEFYQYHIWNWCHLLKIDYLPL